MVDTGDDAVRPHEVGGREREASSRRTARHQHRLPQCISVERGPATEGFVRPQIRVPNRELFGLELSLHLVKRVPALLLVGVVDGGVAAVPDRAIRAFS